MGKGRKNRILTFFNQKKLSIKEKSTTFVPSNDEDEPTALAYTDFSKPMPILEGETAKRLMLLMQEADEKAEAAKNEPITKEDAKEKLSFEKILLEMAEKEIEKRKDRIKKLENIINSNN